MQIRLNVLSKDRHPDLNTASILCWTVHFTLVPALVATAIETGTGCLRSRTWISQGPLPRSKYYYRLRSGTNCRLL
jgi:hypothetical protein